jgi:hypothetical protein
VVVLALAVVAPPSASPSASSPSSAAPADVAGGPCPTGPMPFAGIPGARLVPEHHVTTDDPAVPYVRWRGFAPSFDGMPLSVDVTLPCDPDGPLPLVVMPHGFTDDKTVWEETGKSDSVDSKDRPGPNSHWNTVWFATRGYATLTYTARGWRDSCGPDTPGHTTEAPAPQCAPYQWWIHLDDQRWEVRDLQWLTGGLVQSKIADEDRLAVSGGSYGGAPTAMAALLSGNVVCGAVPQPAELGPDPCTGRPSGAYAPWTTPDGGTPLDWAAALPLYTFGDLLQVLVPNGRGSDGWSQAPRNGVHAEPVGVPLESTLSGLLLAAGVFGSLAPPGRDPTSDIATSANRLLAGNPFPADDPVIRTGISEYREFKSPITISPQGRVPIFWVQGFTDALFPGSEAVQVANMVKAADPTYPFKLFLGDLGHDYASERLDEWEHVHEAMNAFLDHHLRPDRTPERPTYDVSAAITRCLDHDAPMRIVTADDWHGLHPTHVTLTDRSRQETSTADQGSSGRATDPISTATLPGPDSYKGCRIVEPATRDRTAANFTFPIADDLVLLGGPVVDLTFDATGAETPLAVRIWDVAADGSRQGLVTRGIYRVAGGGGTDLHARFQIAPQGYVFPAGHRLKVEVTANDSPYYQASKIPSDVTITAIELVLPEAKRDDATSDARPKPKAGERGVADRDAADDDGGSGPVGLIIGAVLTVVALIGLAAGGRLGDPSSRRRRNRS